MHERALAFLTSVLTHSCDGGTLRVCEQTKATVRRDRGVVGHKARTPVTVSWSRKLRVSDEPDDSCNHSDWIWFLTKSIQSNFHYISSITTILRETRSHLALTRANDCESGDQIPNRFQQSNQSQVMEWPRCAIRMYQLNMRTYLGEFKIALNVLCTWSLTKNHPANGKCGIGKVDENFIDQYSPAMAKSMLNIHIYPYFTHNLCYSHAVTDNYHNEIGFLFELGFILALILGAIRPRHLQRPFPEFDRVRQIVSLHLRTCGCFCVGGEEEEGGVGE